MSRNILRLSVIRDLSGLLKPPQEEADAKDGDAAGYPEDVSTGIVTKSAFSSTGE